MRIVHSLAEMGCTQGAVPNGITYTSVFGNKYYVFSNAFETYTDLRYIVLPLCAEIHLHGKTNWQVAMPRAVHEKRDCSV
jgi:hypothetical protein